MNKFAVLSHVLPPSPSGQSIILKNLLETLNPEHYCLITSSIDQNIQLDKLPCKYFFLSTSNKPKLPFLNTLASIFSRTKQLNKILSEQQCQKIIVCSGDFVDMASGLLSAKILKIKFIPYMFDYFAYQSQGLLGFLSKLLEKYIIKYAFSVIVPNEYLRNAYQSSYNTEATIIRNPCLIPDLSILDKKKCMFNNKYINIVYTGSIYQAHFDAFRDLIDAIKLLKNSQIKLHLFTTQQITELKKEDISGDFIIYHPYIKQGEISTIQRHADILFLPLSLSSPFPAIIKTSAPGKMGEYLSVGKPILVHTPEDSFLNYYFSKYKAGLVNTQKNAKQLAIDLDRLINDTNLQQDFSLNARHQAEKDFDIRNIKNNFYKLLNI